MRPTGPAAAGRREAAAQRDEAAVVSARDVTAFYQTQGDPARHHASLCEHRCLALVGESGSGKTTLARCIAGLHPFRIDGRHRAARQAAGARSRGSARATSARRIQYIFQSPYSSLNPRKTIRQILAQPLDVFFKLSRDEMEDRMVDVLEQVALDSLAAGPLPGPALGRRAPARRHRPRAWPPSRRC